MALRVCLGAAGVDVAGEASSADELAVEAIRLNPSVIIGERELLAPDSAKAFPRAKLNRARLLLLENGGESPTTVEEASIPTLDIENLTPESLMQALGLIENEKASQEPALPHHLARARVHGLSERERTIVALTCLGLETRDIADRLVLSEHTVRNHFKRIFRKLGVGNRASACAQFLLGTAQDSQLLHVLAEATRGVSGEGARY